MAREPVDERLPHAERVVLDQHMMGAERGEPAPLRAMRSRPGGREVNAVAGDVEVIPVLDSEPRPGGWRGSARRRAAARPALSQSPIRSQRWHRGSSRCSSTCQSETTSTESAGIPASSMLARLTSAPISVAASAPRAEGSTPDASYPAAAAASTNRPRPAPTSSSRAGGGSVASDQRQPLAVEQGQRRAGEAMQARRAGGVGARVVEVWHRCPRRDRRSADNTAREQEGTARERRLGGADRSPIDELIPAQAGQRFARRGPYTGPRARVDAECQASRPDRDDDQARLAGPRSDARGRRARLADPASETIPTTRPRGCPTRGNRPPAACGQKP